MSKVRCPRCNGRGAITSDIVNLFDFFVIGKTEDCHACNGTGLVYA